MKRILAIAMALLLLLAACLASCGEAKDPEQDETTPDDSNHSAESATGESETEEKQIQPDLPEMNFGGKEVHCLHWTLGEDGVGGGWIPWEEIAVEQPDGEVMSQAVYDRNGYVEEKYGVQISTEYAQANTELPNRILRAVSTNDPAYSFIVERSLDLRTMWTSGSFYNLKGEELSYLDLSKPWWNKDSLEAFTFGNVTQFASSDMLVLDKSETGVVLFSTSLQTDLGLDDYYQLARDGKWTWDALIRNSEICVSDLDGNLTMDAADRYGSCGNRAPSNYLYVGSGLHFAQVDRDGYIYSDVYSQESINLMQDIHERILYQDFHAHSDHIPDFGLSRKFMANEIEFLFYSVKIANSFRTMETDYGILPIPKYDEEQTRYYNLVMPDGDSVLAVPISNDDPEVTGFVLEALSAKSYYTVYPSFYEVVLKGKSTRDQESREMLDLIFQNRTYDTGLVHGLGGFTNAYVTYAANHYGEVGFVSLCEEYDDIIDSALEDINKLIDDWNKQ